LISDFYILFLFNFFILTTFFAIIHFFVKNLGQECQLLLVSLHHLTLEHSLLIVILHVGDRNTANDIEKEEVHNARKQYKLEGAVASGEQLNHALQASVRFLTLFDIGRDILEDHDLVDTENDAEAHGNAQTRLLLY